MELLVTAFILHVEIRVKIGTEKQFLRRAQEHRKNVLSNEPKCRCFDISVEESAPQNFRLYEVYDDLEAFKNHLATEYMAQYHAGSEPWVEDRKITKASLHNIDQ